MKKVAIFADVQNVYYTCRDIYGRQFDYRAFLKRAAQRGDIVVANAYAIDRGDPKQLKFQEALRHMGFTVKLKPFITRKDGTAKGDWDVGITIDVLDAAPAADVVILLSGDGDFAILMRKIRDDLGVRAEVYGVPELTSQSLVEAASLFHRIDESLLM